MLISEIRTYVVFLYLVVWHKIYVKLNKTCNTSIIYYN